MPNKNNNLCKNEEQQHIISMLPSQFLIKGIPKGKGLARKI